MQGPTLTLARLLVLSILVREPNDLHSASPKHTQTHDCLGGHSHEKAKSVPVIPIHWR